MSPEMRSSVRRGCDQFEGADPKKPSAETLQRREALREAKLRLFAALRERGIEAGVANGHSERGEGLEIVLQAGCAPAHLETCKAWREFGGFPVETRIDEVQRPRKEVA